MWFMIRTVALALWVGAMAGFAFLYAPIAFSHVGPTQAFAATIAASIRALTLWGDVLGAIALAVTLFAKIATRTLAIATSVCIAAAILLGAIETRVIVPAMETTPLLTPAYDALHRQSSGVYGAALLCALAALAMTSWRRSSAGAGLVDPAPILKEDRTPR
jgi:hypothetical protein